MSRSNTAGVGQLLCESPLVAGISFTGSTQVNKNRIHRGQVHKVVERAIWLEQFLSQIGKLLYKQSSSTVKRLGLELGGNAAFLVFPTADLDLAVTICPLWCPFFASLAWFCSDLTMTLTLWCELFDSPGGRLQYNYTCNYIYYYSPGGWLHGEQVPQCWTDLRFH